MGSGGVSRDREMSSRSISPALTGAKRQSRKAAA